MKLGITITAGLSALLLAGCGSGGSPADQASALLAKTGAAKDGPAYMVAVGSNKAECSTGAAEADGTLGDFYVNACTFPSASDVAGYIAEGQYAASAAIIQVGSQELVLVIPIANTIDPPPSAFVNDVAGKVGGTVYS